jgi:hypothetical protein
MVFQMRGLCATEEQIDIAYILLRDSLLTENYTFIGLAGLTNITFNNGTKQWEIISLFQIDGKKGTVLGFHNESVFFPVGEKLWYLRGNCLSKNNDFQSTFLKLSKVG